MIYPQENPELHVLLTNKIVEIKLMMMGFPKSEINLMTRNEMFVLLHLIDYMSRESKDNKEDVA